jgi:hypothetical protein
MYVKISLMVFHIVHIVHIVSNESKNSLARGRILHFLNSYLQETLFFNTCHYSIDFIFWMVNTLLLSVDFPQKITPYDMMEWK